MNRYEVPAEVQRDTLGESARRLYAIEPLPKVTDRIADYQPAILPW